MSRLPSWKTARIWVERMAKVERSNAPIVRFGQAIVCSLKSYTQWKRTLAANSQTSVFLCVTTSEPTKDSIEIKLPEAGDRRKGTAAYH